MTQPALWDNKISQNFFLLLLAFASHALCVMLQPPELTADFCTYLKHFTPFILIYTRTYTNIYTNWIHYTNWTLYDKGVFSYVLHMTGIKSACKWNDVFSFVSFYYFVNCITIYDTLVYTVHHILSSLKFNYAVYILVRTMLNWALFWQFPY